MIEECADVGDRRSFRARQVRQYALTDTMQCACQRIRPRGFLV
jgi:hypothetical protein